MTSLAQALSRLRVARRADGRAWPPGGGPCSRRSSTRWARPDPNA